MSIDNFVLSSPQIYNNFTNYTIPGPKKVSNSIFKCVHFSKNTMLT